ncbi:MAG: amidohydrolase family protein [Kofleriaceae bacterium]
MRKSSVETEPRLPIKIDSTSNGEYWPRPVEPRLASAITDATEQALRNADALGMSRRDYLRSTCAAATTLLAINQVGCNGGRYNVPSEAPKEQAAADHVLASDDLIIDVQTHHVSSDRVIARDDAPDILDWLKKLPTEHCPGATSVQACYSEDIFAKEIFLDSDTGVAVLSALWGNPSPTSVEEAARTRERIAAMGRPRLRIHGVVQPNDGPFEAVRDRMHALASEWKIDAWKLYPVWGPKGVGFRLDDELGRKTIESGLAAGITRFAVHKGLPLAGMDPKYTRPQDVGVVARAYPQATFLIYHSGYESDRREGPYNPKADRGIDALIRSLADNGIGKTGNVYAELGGTWREVMKRPDEAAHVLGKLMAHLGEDRILWGTDAIWYGSPQDQIQAFRAFEITAEFQEQFGYLALTPARKRKVFAANAAQVYGIDVGEIKRTHKTDAMSRARAEYSNDPAPSHRTYGPRTRRDMLSLLRWNGGRPD